MFFEERIGPTITSVLSLRRGVRVNKIYFSKVNDPNEWPDSSSYYFPFAERCMRKGGIFKKFVLWYVAIRMFLEGRENGR